MTLRIAIFATIVSLAAAGLAQQGQQQKTIQLPADHAVSQLKAGPGANAANLYCAICHSVDYIVRQPPMSAAQWNDEVHKMITAYGAPVSEADAKTIAEYIFTTYGARPTAPAAGRGN
jgi:sulfite dehydrogenase (cytochrome) subunit B